MDVKKYQSQIDELAESESEVNVSHIGSQESAIVLGTIFKYAKNYVKMYVGDFNGEISNNEYYLSQVKGYLQKNKELKVIMTSSTPNPSKVFERINLYEGFRDDVRIEYSDTVLEVELNSLGLNNVAGNEKPVHFTVADDKMYRLEIDTKEYFGIACFNNENITKRLSKLFDEKFQKLITV